jgi:hypothetical protein
MFVCLANLPASCAMEVLSYVCSYGQTYVKTKNIFYNEEKGSMFLLEVNKLLPEYTMILIRRHSIFTSALFMKM